MLCLTHGFPAGPKARFSAYEPFLEYLEVLEEQGCREEPARTSLPAFLNETLVVASGGYDLPPTREPYELGSLGRSGTTEGNSLSLPKPLQPPEAIYRRVSGTARGRAADQRPGTMTKMCLRYFQGEAMERTLAWAEGECEGFMRS